MLSSIVASGRWSALKPTNIVPWSVDRPVRHVAAEDLAELILVGARDVRVAGLVVELDALVLRASDHLLLLRDRERLPGGRVVAPLLQEQDLPPAPGRPSGIVAISGASIRSGSRCRR